MSLRELGEGVLWCDEPDRYLEDLREHTRFLDQLWLPCDLAGLSLEQILVINRYREGAISTDGQYKFARQARKAMHRVTDRLEAKKVIEIGCGKFPVEVSAPDYLGVDIDPEAIEAARRSGLMACYPEDICANCKMPADIVLSIYAMHFSISDQLIEGIAKSTTPDAIFCFNMIVEDTVNPVNLLARFSEDWPFAHVVKTPPMSRREYFFVMGRDYSHSRIMLATNSLRSALASE